MTFGPALGVGLTVIMIGVGIDVGMVVFGGGAFIVWHLIEVLRKEDPS